MGKAISFAGILAVLVGVFFAPVPLSIVGIVLGGLALFSPEKRLASITIIIAVIRLILALTNIL